MILYEICKAIEKHCAGLASGTDCVYNILKEKQHKEGEGMTDKNKEAAEIFWLAQLMREAGLNFYFNFEDDRESQEIFDEEYEYMIETQTGELIGSRAPITVFQRDEGLELLDMRPAMGKRNVCDSDGKLYFGLSAEQAMEIIEEFFKTA